MTLENKIDFALIFTVEGANPNGDPLNDNRPRQRFDGRGEISDVCIKRKIRNAIQDMGLPILVQANGRETDEYRSIKSRLESVEAIKQELKGNKKHFNAELVSRIACQTWYDVRAFGQVITISGTNGVGVRGPVTIRTGTSIHPITVNDMQITKSVNGEDNERRGSDTLGMKYTVDFGLYVVYGSISPQLAERTGFTREDANCLKQALINLFETDSSSARPAGSMQVRDLFWWEHHSKMGNTAKVHRSLTFESKVEEPSCYEDYMITHHELEQVTTEVYHF